MQALQSSRFCMNRYSIRVPASCLIHRSETDAAHDLPCWQIEVFLAIEPTKGHALGARRLASGGALATSLCTFLATILRAFVTAGCALDAQLLAIDADLFSQLAVLLVQ